MSLVMTPRRALYVYLKNTRHVNTLKKFGTLSYVSRRFNYATLYVDDEGIDAQVEHLLTYKFVRKVLVSPRPDINPELDNLHDAVFFENYLAESEADADASRSGEVSGT
jgi:uncharacterized protein YlbG (UPF0298 family)